MQDEMGSGHMEHKIQPGGDRMESRSFSIAGRDVPKIESRTQGRDRMARNQERIGDPALGQRLAKAAYSSFASGRAESLRKNRNG